FRLHLQAWLLHSTRASSGESARRRRHEPPEGQWEALALRDDARPAVRGTVDHSPCGSVPHRGVIFWRHAKRAASTGMSVRTERLTYSTGAANDAARRVPALILLVFALDLLLALLYVGNYMVGHEYEPLTRFVDLDGEANLPTWYSSMQWFSVALLLGLFAYRHFEPKTLRSWALIMLPLIFL